MRTIVSVVLGLALLGRAGTAASEQAASVQLSPSFRPPRAGELIVLLPPRSKSPEIAKGEALVVQQLHRQLTEARYKVAMLDAENYATVWNEEVAAVGGIYDPASGRLRAEAYGQAMSALAQRIATDTKCALVLSHALSLRTASLSGKWAEWDGQRRRYETQGGGSFGMTYSGTTAGLSVELLAIAADGRLAFRSFGGATLPYRTNLQTRHNELRPDLFSSGEETAEGVALALKPLLGQ